MHSESYFIIISISSFCSLLAIFSITHHYSKRSLIPLDAWILIVGFIYGIVLKEWDIQNLPHFNLDPQIIILVILPLLIFASGRLINLNDLKSSAVPISFFATIGVVVTSFLIGAPIAWMLNIPLLHGLLIGAAAGATDPAAVASIFHNFKIPERLALLVEGESLFNDGTTVVFFALISSLVLSEQTFSLVDSVGVFVWAILAALPLGALFGWIGAKILNNWQEEYATYDLSMTIIITYASFLIAENLLHVSGVIAVLSTAITFFRYRESRFSRDKKISQSIDNKDNTKSINDFWEYIALVANGVLFFSLGATAGLHDFSEVPTFAVIGAIMSLILARCLLVYGGSLLLAGVKHGLPLQWQHVLVLGGLRGAVSAALILMIPHDYPLRGTFLCLIVAMIIFTLIIQPTLLKYYLKKTTI